MQYLINLALSIMLALSGTLDANVHSALADDAPTIYSIAHICDPTGYDLVMIITDAWEDETSELYPYGELIAFEPIVTDIDTETAHSPGISLAVYETGHPCR